MDFELFLSALKEAYKIKVEEDKIDIYLECQGFDLKEVNNTGTLFDLIILSLKEWGKSVV